MTRVGSGGVQGGRGRPQSRTLRVRRSLEGRVRMVAAERKSVPADLRREQVLLGHSCLRPNPCIHAGFRKRVLMGGWAVSLQQDRSGRLDLLPQCLLRVNVAVPGKRLHVRSRRVRRTNGPGARTFPSAGGGGIGVRNEFRAPEGIGRRSDVAAPGGSVQKKRPAGAASRWGQTQSGASRLGLPASPSLSRASGPML